LAGTIMGHVTLDEAAYDSHHAYRGASHAASCSLEHEVLEVEPNHLVSWTDLEGEERRPTVLVVDDEPSIAELLEDVLDSVGYRVVRATNGRAALAVARRERPVLVLTDRMMPEVDGVEFVRQLRASPVTRDIPVVLMSSTRPDHETMGDIPFLPKPFELDDLIDTVETLTHRSH
jgi:CheY-like chemotaxis protein